MSARRRLACGLVRQSPGEGGVRGLLAIIRSFERDGFILVQSRPGRKFIRLWPFHVRWDATPHLPGRLGIGNLSGEATNSMNRLQFLFVIWVTWAVICLMLLLFILFRPAAW